LNIVVTGGAGFIGSNFIKYKLNNSDDKIIVIDKLTYAGNLENLPQEFGDRLVFYNNDICDTLIKNICKNADGIINFAAETHVDRSIEEPESFIKTDVFGTYNLLEIAKENNIRYLQISTDEVYGSIEEGFFTEESPIQPSSPYSASKVGGDMLVYAYHKTYDTDSLIIRASNNYGPNQYPEKLIPLTIISALMKNRIPVYGDGKQVRNWLYVEDFCSAIDTVFKNGKAGEVYNVGGPDEITNIDVINKILEKIDAPKDLIDYVKDRPGHDKRYSLNSDKLQELGWTPVYNFHHGIEITIEWYKENIRWWERLLDEEFREYYLKQYGRYMVNKNGY
jgi:dTDP-glucose 4,6-dehydratase